MTTRKRNSRSGNAYIEFALSFLIFLTLIVGMFEFSWVLFMRATFHHAVREGVRSAITGNNVPGVNSPLGLDDSIKEVVRQNSFGMLSASDLNAHLLVEFFSNSDGLPTPSADPGNIVKVSIRCIEVWPITNLIRSENPATGQVEPFTFTVSASDKMEPITNAPSRGPTPATTDACPT